MSTHRVFLCQAQLVRAPDQGTAWEAGLAAAGAEVIRMGCLSLCIQCGQQPIARFDGGQPLTGATCEEVTDAVRALVADG
jgi:uncharacterized protein YuzB (UPF0349 family)